MSFTNCPAGVVVGAALLLDGLGLADGPLRAVLSDWRRPMSERVEPIRAALAARRWTVAERRRLSEAATSDPSGSEARLLALLREHGAWEK